MTRLNFAQCFACRPMLLISVHLLPMACGDAQHASNTFVGDCLMPTSASSAPATLAATGCFSATGQPAASLRAYQVNAASWSNGANKSRWVALASHSTGVVGDDGSIALAPGSGIFKEFRSNETKLETRLMLQQPDGQWAGLSYIWNDAQNEATLSADGGAIAVGKVDYQVPTRAQCLECHNAVGGRILGLRSEQLDSATAPSQLQALADAGVLTLDSNVPRPQPWIDPTGAGPLAARARSYLASNCSFCHQPNGASHTDTDYRFSTPLAATGLCNVEPTRGRLGLADARLVAPGDPSRSVLSARVHSSQAATAMPPLGRSVVDAAGAAVLDAWIAALKDCSGP